MKLPNIRKQLLPNDARGMRGIYSRGKAMRMPVNPKGDRPMRNAIARRIDSSYKSLAPRQKSMPPEANRGMRPMPPANRGMRTMTSGTMNRGMRSMTTPTPTVNPAIERRLKRNRNAL